MESGLLLDVVVSQGAAVLQLLAGEDQTLLIRRDSLLVLHTHIQQQMVTENMSDHIAQLFPHSQFLLSVSALYLNLLLDGLDGVGGLDIQRDGLTREGLHENLHRHLCSHTEHNRKTSSGEESALWHAIAFK
jgi:hypothetical protein